MKCRRCNTTTGPSGVCPHCGWSPSGADRFEEPRLEAAEGETGPANLALTQRPMAIDLVEVEPDPIRDVPESGRKTSGPALRPIASALTSAALLLIREAPERLEAGLRLIPESQGDPRQSELLAEAGPVDLLLSDRDGSFVVVVLSDGGSDGVQNALQQVAWVRKQLACHGERVRAIVLVPPDHLPPHDTAVALAGTVAFKTWWLEAHLEQVEP